MKGPHFEEENTEALKAFTPKQREALDALEVAFAHCEGAGLMFFGMDRNLQVYDRREMKKLGYPDKDLHNINDSGKIKRNYAVDTYDTYEDSGGW